MKRRSILRSLAIWVSSLASLFAGHGVMAKSPDLKDLAKNSKKTRPTQAQGLSSQGEIAAGSGGRKPVRAYPWREQIVTTTFWIGEEPTQNNPVPNHKSCWDTNWAENYGGTDTPNRKLRSTQYTPVAFVPRQNPFYVALPYNDKTMTGLKPEVAKVVPWYNETYRGPQKSVCKGRWIAIRYRDRICYAQWEDAGPFRTDHWQYVFGTERPKPNLNKGAGLDVSPAVRDYLGMNDSDVTDWKFVEFDEVPAGPWARFGDNNTFVINQRLAEQQIVTLKTVGAHEPER
jgi:hypothetical protein